MTKFDTNGLTEWLRQTEAILEHNNGVENWFPFGTIEFLRDQKRRLERILKSADGLEPKDGSASEASVLGTVIVPGLAEWLHELDRKIAQFGSPTSEWMQARVLGWHESRDRVLAIMDANNET